jgi:hypothetical protein
VNVVRRNLRRKLANYSLYFDEIKVTFTQYRSSWSGLFNQTQDEKVNISEFVRTRRMY